MTSKIHKQRCSTAIKVRQLYVDQLTGEWQDPSSAIGRFINGRKSSEQAASLKKLSMQLVDGDAPPPILDILIDSYLLCPPKHLVKRALASCLDSVAGVHKHVEHVFQEHILRWMSDESATDLEKRRAVVDMLNSLLENFPLGDRCATSLLKEAVQFLCISLKVFHDQRRNVSTPVALTDVMHHCHVTIQVLNKMVTRAEILAKESQEEVLEMVFGCLHVLWEILLDYGFLMDCRATCGMTLPLLFKLTSGDDVVDQVVGELFPNHATSQLNTSALHAGRLSPHPSFSNQSLISWPTMMTCVVGGCLAMLEPRHLAAPLSNNKTLLVDVFGSELLTLVGKMKEVNSKVLLSRTLVLWSSKSVQVLEQTTSCDNDVLKRSLCGDSSIPSQFLDYTWNHWEDATDVIRHQARLIFDNLLKCHLLSTGEEPSASPFLLQLAKSLMSGGWQQRGRYGPLCCLVGHLGTGVLLSSSADLPRHLLAAMTDQTLAGYVSELYERLFSEHRIELSTHRDDPANHMNLWFTTWVQPLLDCLCYGGRLQKTHIIEYILPKLLKHSPDSLPYMIKKLTEDEEGTKIGALVTCLKRAKMLGLLQHRNIPGFLPEDSQDTLWYGVVSTQLLRRALCHHNEQVRLDAFGLLCENPKTTETLTATDLELVIFFLPLNVTSQAPAFRQQLVALLKKFFVRLRDGAQSLNKKAKGGDATASVDLDRYREFVVWLLQEQFRHLYLGAAFPSRTMALSTLRTYTTVMLEEAAPNHEESSEFALSNYMTAPRVQTLLECLTDSFEQNKADSYAILISMPYETLRMQETVRLESLFTTALTLAASTRPQDSTTAAYLFRVLLTHPLIYQVASHHLADQASSEGKSGQGAIQILEGGTQIVGRRRSSGSKENDVIKESNGGGKITGEEADVFRGHLVVLRVLIAQLRAQLDVAQKSLIHAAATQPLYPTMLCIRYLLEDVNLGAVANSTSWRHLLKDAIEISFEVAQVVSPVVSNSSPEGNVPLGPGLELEAVVRSPEDVAALRGAAKSLQTVSLIPEYLVVCCWRSIKECSLLLGQLTRTAPLIDPQGSSQGCGLISMEQIHSIGAYFTTQLLESRHRGAFELAYAGFVKMTEMLWKCPFTEVQALPSLWLNEIVKDVKSREANNRLCSTRRSAGVPFYVQAIVSTELTTGGRACFKQLMSELLVLASPASVHPGHEDTAQVHSLNILRALYRDTRLGDDVFPYIADGLRAAILGYGSQLWAIRNSATLMFSALMTRIFGVKRSKDDMSKKNCLTGRVFFHRFPSLYQFLLDQLEAGTSNIGSGGAYKLHPGLYPVLMVLGRLYPSVVEGSNTTLNTTAFIPYVVRCACSPVYKTRIMAARAIRPLVGNDQITTTINALFQYLPTTAEGATSQNLLHGILLQLTELVRSVSELPSPMATSLQTVLTKELLTRTWLLSNENPCVVTRTSFVNLAFALMTSAHAGQASGLDATIMTQAVEQLTSPTAVNWEPWISEYLETLAHHVLSHLVSKGTQTGGAGDSRNIEFDTSALLVNVLQSPVYEVRLKGLDILERDFSPHDSECYVGDLGPCEGKDSQIKTLQVDKSVFYQLVSMMMSEEHQECLGKVLKLLCLHEMTTITPWKDNTSKNYDHFQILDKLVQQKDSLSDDVRCAAQKLSGRLMPGLYALASKGSSAARELLQAWITTLEGGCATQESVSSRSAVASCLLQNGGWLLVDPCNLLGSRVYDAWTVLVRLLQDEDCDVRHMAARVVHDLSDKEDSTAGAGDYGRLQEIKQHMVMHSYTSHSLPHVSTGGYLLPQPTLALDVAVRRMVALWAERDWRGVLRTLLTWLTKDLEPDWPDQEEKEVRLFDKGEMNTYRDEMIFLTMVARQLRIFLRRSNISLCPEKNMQSSTDFWRDSDTDCTDKARSPRLNMDLFTEPNFDNVLSCMRLSFLRGELKKLVSKLSSAVHEALPISGGVPFLMTSQYQATMMAEVRLMMAIQCVAEAVLTKEKAEQQVAALSSQLGGQFQCPDAVSGTILEIIY